MYDELALDRISFAEWLIALDKVAVERGYTSGQLVEITGQLQWFQSYENNVTPEAAFKEAETDAERFGAEYCHEI